MVLKHIDDAIRDGDTVRAIIRGSGVNQDGKTPGITLPSSEAQASLIRSTYQAAGLDFSQTRYFEAHGTGTAAGDPLEMMAIASTFGQESNDPTRPLYVGTVKPNIGHLEGCAGMAGIVKTVLSLEAGIIPPNLNFKVPNPKLKLKEWNIQIPTECTLWPQDGLRRASVNSFGYGGTNAHVILDDAWHYLKLRNLSGHTSTVSTIPSLPTDVDSEHSCPPSNSASSSNEPIISRSASSIEGNPSRSTWASSTSVDQHGPRPQYRIYLFSAPDQGAVKRSMLEYSSFLNRQVFESEFDNDVLMRDLAHTLGQRRSKFQWRSVVVSSSTKDLATVLTSAHPSRPAETPRVVWIFTGQGAQWFAMGRELLSYDVFKTSILDSDKYLTIIGADWSVYDELGASERSSRINDARFSQPLCAVLQIALIDLMRHWGLSPAAVVGHSSGEIAAAYALGALSAHDSLKIAFHRGRLAESVALVAPHLSGSMLNVGLSEQDVRPYLTLLGPEDVVVIGCVNSPTNVTLSGDTTALEKIEDALKQTEVFVRKLQVDNAYHSPHMKVISDTYLDSIRDISPVQSTGDTVMYSSVTGREISSLDLGPSYWVENMTSPVQFVKALENLSGSSTKPTLNRRLQNIIVEVGPHRALQGPIKQFLKKQKDLEGTHYCSVLHRGEDAVKTSLEAMAVLLSKGLSLDLPRLNSFWKESTTPKVLTKLPCYPWYHRKRYWHQSSQERSHLFPTAPRLDWLGAPMEDFNPLEPRWKNTLRISELPWLEDHKMDTNIIYPGAGMLCCALEAARQVADPTRIVENFELRDITIGKALLIPEGDRGVEIFTHLKPRKTGMLAKDAPWFEYTFYSLKEDGGHIEHSSGLITIEYKNDDETVRYQNYTSEAQILKEEYERFLNECTVEMSSEAIYTELAARGMNFGEYSEVVWSESPLPHRN
jgi:acyl transferase domain-containing protein